MIKSIKHKYCKCEINLHEKNVIVLKVVTKYMLKVSVAPIVYKVPVIINSKEESK